MLSRIKKIMKSEKGVINTIELLGWVAVVSLVLVAVVTTLKPTVVGSNSTLSKANDRVISLDDIMKP